jgi:ribonuclease HI
VNVESSFHGGRSTGLLLINDNYSENDVIIYIDGSVKQTFSEFVRFYSASERMNVHEDNGAFYHSPSSMTMEVMAVTKALSWLVTLDFTNVCNLSDSVSILRKIEAG